MRTLAEFGLSLDKRPFGAERSQRPQAVGVDTGRFVSTTLRSAPDAPLGKEAVDR
jgi:hypothetical protein